MPNLQSVLQETPDCSETAVFTAVSANRSLANIANCAPASAVIAVFLMRLPGQFDDSMQDRFVTIACERGGWVIEGCVTRPPSLSYLKIPHYLTGETGSGSGFGDANCQIAQKLTSVIRFVVIAGIRQEVIDTSTEGG